MNKGLPNKFVPFSKEIHLRDFMKESYEENHQNWKIQLHKK